MSSFVTTLLGHILIQSLIFLKENFNTKQGFEPEYTQKRP
jgi:hypothetical protein